MDDVCVYCAGAADTNDHVPGRQFFPQPLPPDLLTVPACESCNKGFKSDEDYLRALLCLGPGGVTQIGAELWTQKLHRTFQKDQGLRAAIARRMSMVRRMSPAGLDLGDAVAIEIEWPRIDRIVRKWVRALYFHEYSEVLDPAVRITPSGVDKPSSVLPTMVLSICVPGSTGWSGVFEYRHARGPDHPLRSLWYFRMFGCYDFIAKSAEPPATTG